jgi:hypothetical protein
MARFSFLVLHKKLRTEYQYQSKEMLTLTKDQHKFGAEMIYRICACISRTFPQEFTPQNWGAAYTRNIMSF